MSSCLLWERTSWLCEIACLIRSVLLRCKWGFYALEGRRRGGMRLCTWEDLIAILSYPLGFQAHVESLLKTQNLPTYWFPNWFVLAGSQGTCQPRKFSHREASRLGSCRLGQNGCSWCELCNATSSNPNSSPANGDGLNRDRQQQEDERAEVRKGPCVIRFSLLMSLQSLIQLGREREYTFPSDVSKQTSLLLWRDSDESQPEHTDFLPCS